MLRLLLTLCMVTALNGQADREFIDDVVKQHNVYRALHGVPEVIDNTEMNVFAQMWATYLYENNMFMPNPNAPKFNYGENLSWLSPTATGVHHVFNLYFSEAKFYAENKWCGGEPDGALFSKYGHYTQIVWKQSSQIGVGRAGGIVVINYSPQGNDKGSYAENVPCPSSYS